MIGHLAGMKIAVSPHMTKFVEDWSGCRSRARAERRQKQGHQQRVKLVAREPQAYVVGDTVFVGPETYKRLLTERTP